MGATGLRSTVPLLVYDLTNCSPGPPQIHRPSLDEQRRRGRPKGSRDRKPRLRPTPCLSADRSYDTPPTHTFAHGSEGLLSRPSQPRPFPSSAAGSSYTLQLDAYPLHDPSVALPPPAFTSESPALTAPAPPSPLRMPSRPAWIEDPGDLWQQGTAGAAVGVETDSLPSTASGGDPFHIDWLHW